MLHLSYLGSGAFQHVFVSSENPAGDWVYKIPAGAADGLTLPVGAVGILRSAPPRGTLKRALHAGLVTAPDRVDAWVAALRDRPTKTGWPTRAVVHVADALVYAILGTRTLALEPWFRRGRRRHFERMLRLMARLAEQGDGDLLVPYRTHQVTAAVLRCNGSAVQYRGPMVVQRRATHFLRIVEAIRRPVIRDVVRIQHRLWSLGIALTESHEVFGVRGWCEVDGSVRLADTSSLTEDPRAARRLLGPEGAERERRRAERLVRGTPAEPLLAAYFEEARRSLSLAEFDRRWRVTVPAR